VGSNNIGGGEGYEQELERQFPNLEPIIRTQVEDALRIMGASNPNARDALNYLKAQQSGKMKKEGIVEWERKHMF
jgi:hypothetical protein